MAKIQALRLKQSRHQVPREPRGTAGPGVLTQVPSGVDALGVVLVIIGVVVHKSAQMSSAPVNGD